MIQYYYRHLVSTNLLSVENRPFETVSALVVTADEFAPAR